MIQLKLYFLLMPDGTSGFRKKSDSDVDSATNDSLVDTSDSDTLVTIVNMLREYV
jgi:hypothetical protein